MNSSLFLTRIRLHSFRNYKETVVEFSPQINAIWGSNAQGKTSLLEAIYVLMIGRSFRSRVQSDLILMGSKGFSIEIHFIKQGIEQKLRVTYNGNERKIIYNSTEYSSTGQLIGILPGVLIAPDDDLVKGPPQVRRLFLDLQIAQTDPLYVHYLTRYNRALRQRNQLLRTHDLISIESWESELAQAAAYIIQKRHMAVLTLQKICQQYYSFLSGESAPIALQYRLKCSEPSDLNSTKLYYIEQYRRNREREIVLGTTLSGPHRDELEISIEGHPARNFGSEGQKRTCVMALRLSAWKCLKETMQELPLLLIDDLTVCLDETRQDKLMDHLTTFGQVFVTTTDKNLFQRSRYSPFTLQIRQGSVCNYPRNGSSR